MKIRLLKICCAFRLVINNLSLFCFLFWKYIWMTGSQSAAHLHLHSIFLCSSLFTTSCKFLAVFVKRRLNLVETGVNMFFLQQKLLKQLDVWRHAICVKISPYFFFFFLLTLVKREKKHYLSAITKVYPPQMNDKKLFLSFQPLTWALQCNIHFLF